LDVDLQAKEVLKYDTELEAGAREWIEAVLGEKLPHPDFLTNLKDGVILCRYLHFDNFSDYNSFQFIN
jgi:hypothetical protein